MTLSMVLSIGGIRTLVECPCVRKCTVEKDCRSASKQSVDLL